MEAVRLVSLLCLVFLILLFVTSGRDEMIICCNNGGKRKKCGRSWVKLHRAKWFRRICCNGKAEAEGTIDHVFVLLAFLLLLSGDVETNPGPDSSSKESLEEATVIKSLPIKIDLGKVSEQLGYYDDMSDIKETLKLLRDGQAAILRNQDAMISRISSMENELEMVKSHMADLGCKQSTMENVLDDVQEKILERQSDAKDLHFDISRLEQYSRKSSVRVLNVSEDRNENIQEKLINVIRQEIDVSINPSEIDIVHRLGRPYNDGHCRPILVKFMSHKTKEKVMKNKKKAKNVKIFKDLAKEIKVMLDQIVEHKTSLRIDKCWTIDGRIKYKFVDDARTIHEIRSFSDYHQLFNGD